MPASQAPQPVSILPPKILIGHQASNSKNEKEKYTPAKSV
jgi:hypothetical protein